MQTLKLNGFDFIDLFSPTHLAQLDKQFLTTLKEAHPNLHTQLLAYRREGENWPAITLSEFIIALAPFLEQFIADLFSVNEAVVAAKMLTLKHQPIFVFKEWYVKRQAKRRLRDQETLPPFEELDIWLSEQLNSHQFTGDDKELAVALLGEFYLQEQAHYKDEIDQLTAWCIAALTQAVGKAAVKNWVSFKLPEKLDYQRLVPVELVSDDPLERLQGPPSAYRQRDGFKLTDDRMNERQFLNEIDYCVYCHKNDGDFCSKGFPVKKTQPELGLKKNPLGEILTGCPLEEKISEMHVLKKAGHSIAPLAVIMIDNPMCPATGHRICNDCMKACIYQKQEPVNIPQTETGILTDVLNLPWGVEIYDLLTRWNPLRARQWIAKPYQGLNVMIMGMGPAGFTLAHHLLMEGCAVVGVDGLKIEPLPEKLIHTAIYDFQSICESLDERIMAGFGGVAEYGITVRWDKNFLKLIYLSLMRRPYFQVFGNVRFGGTITVEEIPRMGFHHLAVAVGAGLPQELPIPGSMAPGMRQANDFLMALQLTGAAKTTSLANLQLRLPALVIGGGLTGIDTATEAQAYYIAQVEKALARYETLVEILGEARVREQFDDQAFAILNEFLEHGKAVRKERKRAKKTGEKPDFIRLLRAWGGVTVVYRRKMEESPAYKRNHEEMIKALEEGIYYLEGLEPVAVRLDKNGEVEGLVCQARVRDEQGAWMLSSEETLIPARAILVATGAKPNIAYEFEHRGTFRRVGLEYQAYRQEGVNWEIVPPAPHCKTEKFGAFTSYDKNGFRVSFLGDTHPVFHGSVVKAIASAKRVYPKIMTLLSTKTPLPDAEIQAHVSFAARIKNLFTSQIIDIKRQTPSIIELIVKAPQAAKHFLPGHFYRVQTFESAASKVNNTTLHTESIALLGTEVNKEKGTIKFMVLERGASSRLFATLKIGDALSVMGPTGVRAKIPHDKETVMIIGGRLGAAQIQTVGTAMRALGNRVLYIAGFRTADEVYCQRTLEDAADKIIWVTEFGTPVASGRPQDVSVTGDMMSVLLRYATGRLSYQPDGENVMPLESVNRVIIIGMSRLIRNVQQARQTFLKPFFTKNPLFIASVYAPMQCMLKGVCAQCLQWQIDPITGRRKKAVFACSWHDQPLDLVDIDSLDDRLAQNHTQEILSNLWLDYLFNQFDVSRV